MRRSVRLAVALTLLVLPVFAGCLDRLPETITGPDPCGPQHTPDPPAEDGQANGSQARDGPRHRPIPNASVGPQGNSSIDVNVTPVVAGLDKPADVAFLGEGLDRFIVAEQGGVVEVVTNGRIRSQPLIDLTSRVSTGPERGLFAVEPHPDFEENGALLVSWTDTSGDSVLARFHVDPDTLAPVDASDHDVVLEVPQTFPVHNGGYAVYGPDGHLYYGLGDGGSRHDRRGHGLNPGTLLGSILRLDVGPSGDYRIPPDNPFADREGCDEVWAHGLRNPWRFSFDPRTGDMWIADVGEAAREEVNLEPEGAGGGRNYGWNTFEGSTVFEPGNASRDEVVFPVAEYRTHVNGTCSVTGGYRYRGSNVTDLGGKYVFADFCNGAIRTLSPDGDAWVQRTLLETERRISSFGQTPDGELVVVDHHGGIYELVPEGT